MAKQKEVTFNSVLEKVREENPEMKFKDQQKQAALKFAEYKKFKGGGSDSGGGSDKPKSAKEVFRTPVGGLSGEAFDALKTAEKRIRATGMNVNNIVLIGREVIPDGKLTNNGKIGVNTRFTFENEEGVRLPVEGFFIAYQ
jgi:hypothetical protein